MSPFLTRIPFNKGLGSRISVAAVPPPDPPVTAGLVLNLDAGNVASYPGSGTIWTDTVGSKVFTLAGTLGYPSYSSSNGGYLNFVASAGHYGSATSFDSVLTTYTIEVWHLFNGTSTGAAPVLFGEGRASYSN